MEGLIWLAIAIPWIIRANLIELWRFLHRTYCRVLGLPLPRQRMMGDYPY